MKKTEVWKSLDFMGYPDYEVSNFGRVKSLNYRHKRIEGILKQSKNRGGYLIVTLCQNRKMKNFQVHRLVALAFIPNPENYNCVNHKDENPSNNHVDNLEWCTHEYNMNYGTRNDKVRKAHKGKPKTEEHKKKLSKSILQFTLDNIFIREWDSITQAEQELNLSHISDCCKNKRNKCGGFIWRYK